ncbi:hypothetical protein B7486_55815 [cyanobacterium TDX16]|nr:hypothetical protein B7486_55815 [cyanobacterium TDX16]
MDTTTRPTLDRGLDAAPVEDFIAELQAAIDAGDAARFDGRFARDVLWGSPFGAVVDGFDEISTIHAAMLSSVEPVPGSSTYVIEHVRRPTDDVAIAYVRRISATHAEVERPGRADSFDELALFVLVRRDGEWWLAAGQHLPDRRAEAYG